MAESGDAPEVAPTGESTDDPGWEPGEDTPSGDDAPGAGHPRSPDADAAPGAEDTVVRDMDPDAPGSDESPVKEGAAEEGWGSQSGAQDDEGAMGQD